MIVKSFVKAQSVDQKRSYPFKTAHKERDLEVENFLNRGLSCKDFVITDPIAAFNALYQIPFYTS